LRGLTLVVGHDRECVKTAELI